MKCFGLILQLFEFLHNCDDHIFHSILNTFAEVPMEGLIFAVMKQFKQLQCTNEVSTGIGPMTFASSEAMLYQLSYEAIHVGSWLICGSAHILFIIIIIMTSFRLLDVTLDDKLMQSWTTRKALQRN